MITAAESTENSEQQDDWTPVRFDAFLFLARIIRRWRFIGLMTLLFALVALTFALTRKPYFEGTASFLPPARDLGAGGQMTPYSIFGASTQSTTYIGFLKSRTVQHSVVTQLGLTKVYKAPDEDVAAAIVGGSSKVDATQDGIVTIRTQASTPELAASLANAYLVAVHDLTQKMTEESLRQRAGFYADQLAQSRRQLEAAEAALQANQESGGVLDPSSSTQVAIAAQARLQTLIQAAEVQLSSLLQSNTESSPAVVRARSELAELRAQLSRQTSKAKSTARGVEAGGALPGLAISAVRRQREVREREAVYESLLRQTEVNHMGQEDPGPQLQVIDRATVPRRKAGPGRMRYLVGGTFLGFAFAVFWAATSTWLTTTVVRMHQAVRSSGASH